MSSPYRQILKEVRLAFPQPVSDPIHDSYFVHSIMRALDQVDGLKSHLPILGAMVPGDFAEARKAALPEGTSSVEAVTSDLVGYLRGQRVRTLIDGPVAAGYGEASWDGRDQGGRPVAGGVYLYRLETGTVKETRKLLFLR